MKMVEVVDLPVYEISEYAHWYAVIGPGRHIIALCVDQNMADQIRSLKGLATHEVKHLRQVEE